MEFPELDLCLLKDCEKTREGGREGGRGKRERERDQPKIEQLYSKLFITIGKLYKDVFVRDLL